MEDPYRGAAGARRALRLGGAGQGISTPLQQG